MISQTKQKGFTIVELLIVIVVIAILAAISIVAYNNVTQKARDDQRLSDARNIGNALAAYNSEHSRWISDATGATFATTLTGFDTVRVGDDTIKKIIGTPTADLKDQYEVIGCGTSPFTGVQVKYYKEAGDDKGLKSLTFGVGCPTTP